MSEGRYRLQGRHQGSRILPDIVSTIATSFILGKFTGDLKLGTNSQSSSSSLCLPNALNNPVTVALPIESPLVQVAVVKLASCGKCKK